MSFEAGTVVWVKLKSGRLWWAGEVTNEYPDSLLSRNRTDPIAVVKFFSDENEFEVIKKEAEIVSYNHDKKIEFIKKGKSHLAKNKQDLKKFIDDCKKAESLTGGNEDSIDAIEITQNIPKKSVYAELFKTPPRPTPPKPIPSPGLIKLPFRKTGTPSKKPRLTISTPQIVEGKRFNCDECGFTSDRITVLTSHRRLHTSTTVASTSSRVKAKSPVKVAPVEKPLSPKKPTVVAKTSPAKRGRKRKAPRETTPPATDKQEILADWSDAEDGSAESPIAVDLEPKKPRTDQELHDAFESLLKTTKPVDEVDKEPKEKAVKSSQDSTKVERDVDVVHTIVEVVFPTDKELVQITEEAKEEISESITEEKSIHVTEEKSIHSTEETSTHITKEKSIHITEEKSIHITEENSTVIGENSTIVEGKLTTFVEEKFINFTEEKFINFTEEKFINSTEEKFSTFTEKKVNNFTEEKFTTFTQENPNTNAEEESIIISDEKSITIANEKSITIADEKSITIADEKSITITDEKPTTIADEKPNSIAEEESSFNEKSTIVEISTVADEKSTIAEIPTVADEKSTTAEISTVADEKSSIADEISTVADEKLPIADEISSVTDENFTIADEETAIADKQSTVAGIKSIADERFTTIADEKYTTIADEKYTTIADEKYTTTTDETSITISEEETDTPNQAYTLPGSETVSHSKQEEPVAGEVEVDESIPVESPEVPSVSGSPAAKVVGVSKVIKSSISDCQLDTKKAPEKPFTDDVDELENEVEALLAATKPVEINRKKLFIEINHEKLFIGRPELHYTVNPKQVKKFEVASPPLVATEELPVTSTQGQGKSIMELIPNPFSPTKSDVPMAPPFSYHSPQSHVEINATPQTPTKVVTVTHTLAVKSQPPPPVELVKPGMGGAGTLKITKSPPPPLLQERIVVLPPDSIPTNLLKSPSPLVYSGPGVTPQAVKVYNTLPVTSTAAVLTPTPKKSRVKKQTLTERVGVVQSSPLGVTPTKYTTLTGAQFVSSPLGTKVHGAAVQTVQTKSHALPTVSPTIGHKSTPTGMVRLTASNPQLQGLRGMSSPSILTKAFQQLKYQRQQTPLFVSTPQGTTSSHYEIVTSGVGTKQEANELILVSQPSQPQQQFVLASTSAIGGVISQAMSMKPGQKKRAPPKKAITAPVVKTPEVAKAKPTAAVKPQLSEEEKLSSAKMRQALLAGQKTEKILTAEKVVHLLPMENSDGTVTYMLVHMDEVGGGIQIDQADAPKTHPNVDPVFADTASSAEQLLHAIIQKHPAPVTTTSKKVTNRKGQAISRSPGIIQQRPRTSQPSIIAQTQQLHLHPPQSLQQRHVIIGQQQHLLQFPVQKQPTMSQQFQHLVQSQKQPTPVTQYQFVQSQRQPMIGQQQVQRSVFVTQPQQIVVTPHQQHQVIGNIQTQAMVVTTQHQQIQQQMIHAQQPSPVTHVPVPTQSYQVQQIQESVLQQEDEVLQAQLEEPPMPPLVDTKSRGIALIADASSLQSESTHEEVQRMEVAQQQQLEVPGTLEDVSMAANAEVPMEIQQDYQVQIVTAEDGTQYYLTPDGLMEQGYFQLQTEGEGAAYDLSGLGGEQFLIMQEDGTFVTPQELGMDLEQCRALQQQQEQQQLLEQQVLQQQEQQLQEQNQNM